MVVIGSVFVDIKGYPEAAFIPGGRNVGRVEVIHGGVGRNVAEDIANCELRPVFLSMVDDSGTGEDVLRRLNAHRVNTDYVSRSPDGMGTWLAVFDNGGDVAAAVSKRPDLSPIADTLRLHGDEIFSHADSVAIEIDIGRDIVKTVLRLAQKYGIPVYAVVSNMSIAMEQRDLIRRVDCFVCNRQEAGILFSENYADVPPSEMADIVARKASAGEFRRLIVTLAGDGAAFYGPGEQGFCPAWHVDVRDTTGAGDAFFSGAAIGLTYGKSLAEACKIGARLAASVIVTSENVCPRFQPRELGLGFEGSQP